MRIRREKIGFTDIGIVVLHLASEHAVERVGSLVDQRFGVVGVGMEVFECQVAVVTDFVERLDDGRPVGRAVEQRPERLQRVIRSPLVNSFRCTLRMRLPRMRIQCSGNWNSMMLPVSKWT